MLARTPIHTMPGHNLRDPHAASGRLNVLLILADDLRPQLGAYGVRAANTPHLDAFAKRSLTFDHAFAQVPACLPSRNSFLTGRSPDHPENKVYWFEGSPDVKGNIFSKLKAKGYLSLGVGKVFHNGFGSRHDNFSPENKLYFPDHYHQEWGSRAEEFAPITAANPMRCDQKRDCGPGHVCELAGLEPMPLSHPTCLFSLLQPTSPSNCQPISPPRRLPILFRSSHPWLPLICLLHFHFSSVPSHRTSLHHTAPCPIPITTNPSQSRPVQSYRVPSNPIPLQSSPFRPTPSHPTPPQPPPPPHPVLLV